MFSITSKRLFWFWPVESEFQNELMLELGVTNISQEFVEEVRRVIARYVLGKARRNKDYKELVSFRELSMFELRFTVLDCGRARPVRLICSDYAAGVFVLLWHVKDPSSESEVQRGLMNDAVTRAISRLETMAIDREEDDK